jgi:hypothetical protein
MFRFTIRDVLLLTAIVALAIAWYVDHSKYETDLRHADKVNDLLRDNLASANANLEWKIEMLVELQKEYDALQAKIAAPAELNPHPPASP